jgi:hypothetical protein
MPKQKTSLTGDMVHPRGKVTGTGRSWDDGMSDRNGPSDHYAQRHR